MFKILVFTLVTNLVLCDHPITISGYGSSRGVQRGSSLGTIEFGASAGYGRQSPVIISSAPSYEPAPAPAYTPQQASYQPVTNDYQQEPVTAYRSPTQASYAPVDTYQPTQPAPAYAPSQPAAGYAPAPTQPGYAPAPGYSPTQAQPGYDVQPSPYAIEQAVSSASYGGDDNTISYGTPRYADGYAGPARLSRKIYFFKGEEDGDYYEDNTPVIVRSNKKNLQMIFIKAKEPKRGKTVVVTPPKKQALVYLLSPKDDKTEEIIHVPHHEEHEPKVFFVDHGTDLNSVLPDSYGVTYGHALSSGGYDVQREFGPGQRSGPRQTIVYRDESVENAGYGQQGVVISAPQGGQQEGYYKRSADKPKTEKKE